MCTPSLVLQPEAIKIFTEFIRRRLVCGWSCDLLGKLRGWGGGGRCIHEVVVWVVGEERRGEVWGPLFPNNSHDHFTHVPPPLPQRIARSSTHQSSPYKFCKSLDRLRLKIRTDDAVDGKTSSPHNLLSECLTSCLRFLILQTLYKVTYCYGRVKKVVKVIDRQGNVSRSLFQVTNGSQVATCGPVSMNYVIVSMEAILARNLFDIDSTGPSRRCCHSISEGNLITEGGVVTCVLPKKKKEVHNTPYLSLILRACKDSLLACHPPPPPY